ncbi:FecR domain-containing protein [Verrucomicrobiaceae bacterium N1E253]|uniref:FecR domain-containing protein n=1 Tax=Oceaniferula marina TaxID=2748318 RepID=A0A851GDR1_9BACT|nr:LamG-like jellyroll fold domain-containing protein [Oceaniferula marina]NWK55072.1 FecR domain-containing protein [Oceaniferula marina]
MKPRELENLIQDFLDGSLAEEKLETLQHELRHNPEARDLYRDFIHLQNIIELQALTPDPLAKNIIPIDRIIQRQKRRNLSIALASAAALLIISLVTMRLFFVDPVEPASLAFQTSPGTQFTISHDESADAPLGQRLVPGSRLQIKQGSAQLRFPNGVQSIVIGPADLTLHDEEQLYLRRGVARFQVPQGAEGFTVDTPDLHIVDLGTEFGVKADPDQHDEVHVLKGHVQVTAKRLRKESTTLGKGEARRIDPVGRLHAIATQDASFPSKLPNTLPYLHWSFDRDMQVSGTHPDVPHISTSAEAPTKFVDGRLGTSLSFDGKNQHLITDWPGFSKNRPRTVSFWLKLPANEDYRATPGILGWGDRTHGNKKWKVALAPSSTSGTPRLRLSWGNIWLTATSPLATNQWQHITVTSSDLLDDFGFPQAQLYINGIQQKSSYEKQGQSPLDSPIQTSTTNLKSSPLMIGSDLFVAPKDRNLFRGQIDELYIFDGHMTTKEVKQLLKP